MCDLLDIVCDNLGVGVFDRWIANDGLTYQINDCADLSVAISDETGLEDCVWNKVDISPLLLGTLKPIKII